MGALSAKPANDCRIEKQQTQKISEQQQEILQLQRELAQSEQRCASHARSYYHKKDVLEHLLTEWKKLLDNKFPDYWQSHVDTPQTMMLRSIHNVPLHSNEAKHIVATLCPLFEDSAQKGHEAVLRDAGLELIDMTRAENWPLLTKFRSYAEKFPKACRRVGWHTTDCKSAEKIMQEGFKIPEMPVNGWVNGRGVYVSSNKTKAPLRNLDIATVYKKEDGSKTFFLIRVEYCCHEKMSKGHYMQTEFGKNEDGEENLTLGAWHDGEYKRYNSHVIRDTENALPTHMLQFKFSATLLKNMQKEERKLWKEKYEPLLPYSLTCIVHRIWEENPVSDNDNDSHAKQAAAHGVEKKALVVPTGADQPDTGKRSRYDDDADSNERRAKCQHKA